MKLIEILPNVYGVKVPSDANDFNKCGNDLIYDPNPFNKDELYVIEKIDYDFKIIGILTKDEISFDASELFKIVPLKYWHNKNIDFIYKNPENTFRSALPDEIYFENEYGSEEPNLEPECCGFWEDDGFGNPTCCQQPIPSSNSRQLQDLWQTTQENITEKLLILHKL